MPSAADRLDLAPHREPGALRSLVLAVLVHLLLIAALTWGVNWKHSNPDISFEAELWSSVPQEAAPKLVEAPPPPPPHQGVAPQSSADTACVSKPESVSKLAEACACNPTNPRPKTKIAKIK